MYGPLKLFRSPNYAKDLPGWPMVTSNTYQDIHQRTGISPVQSFLPNVFGSQPHRWRIG